MSKKTPGYESIFCSNPRGSAQDGIIAGMEGFQPLRTLRRTLQERLNNVLSQRFFHDRMSVTVLLAATLVNFINIILLAFKLHPTEFPVPVHFSSYTQYDQLGPWYFPLIIAFVALGITFVNVIFAYHSFSRSRLASFFLLVAALVVAIFSFIISEAFGAIR